MRKLYQVQVSAGPDFALPGEKPLQVGEKIIVEYLDYSEYNGEVLSSECKRDYTFVQVAMAGRVHNFEYELIG